MPTLSSSLSPVRTTMFQRLAILVAAAAFGLAAPAALAASPAYLHVVNNAMGGRQAVTIDVNKSVIVDLPTNVGEVIATQPAIAAVVMRTKTRAIIEGIAAGGTNVFFLDPAGNNISVLDVTVQQPPSDVGTAIEAAIARNVPGSHVKVESIMLGGSTTRVVLSGTALSQDDAARAMTIATQFAGGTDNVANIITVNGNQQVMLKVTVAEVDRTAIKQLGLNLNMSLSSGGLITGLVNTPNSVLGGVSGVSGGEGTISASANIGPASITATLAALSRRNAIRTLAEPTLTAMSGQPAEFLAGGQKAITTVDKNGTAAVIYKDYGVALDFTPTVKSNGSIDLQVNTSVSQPIGNTDFSTRSAKTDVEIPAGCTLAIGGLLQDTEKHQLSGLPGIDSIPILGALFRSRDYIHDQTELVIMVTPVMAQLGRPDLPTDDYHIAGDAEAIFLGHLEKQYGVGADGMRGGYKGSVGFVLD